MGFDNCTFVVASLMLSATSLAVGISFFGPYWLSNIQESSTYNKEIKWSGKGDYLSSNFLSVNTSNSVMVNPDFPPDRGLWAQCGMQCNWFWNHDYMLQKNILSPLKWHLATQILYFIAATMVLFTELYARIQMCCRPRSTVFISIGVILFISALIQVAAVATFGGGAVRDPYYAETDPKEFTKFLGQKNVSMMEPYLGWCYWMAVTGAIMSVITAILFCISGCCFTGDDKYD